ncbi:MAG: MerR family transcriptional regulator [Thiohalomonadales bacterium]
MGINRYFTAQEVIACTSITYRRLDYWVRQGIIRASRRSVVRRGTPRLFTFTDIVEVRVAMKLIDNGLRLATLRKSLKSIRRQLPNIEAPLASKRLVTDGKTVFRYDPDLGALESMDEYGQFAFWFGLGEEVQAVIREVEKMPKPVRYKRRMA